MADTRYVPASGHSAGATAEQYPNNSNNARNFNPNNGNANNNNVNNQTRPLWVVVAGQ